MIVHSILENKKDTKHSTLCVFLLCVGVLSMSTNNQQQQSTTINNNQQQSNQQERSIKYLFSRCIIAIATIAIATRVNLTKNTLNNNNKININISNINNIVIIKINNQLSVESAPRSLPSPWSRSAARAVR
jgi:hypothetical protein